MEEEGERERGWRKKEGVMSSHSWHLQWQRYWELQLLRDHRPPPSQSAPLPAPQHDSGLAYEWKPLCLREGEGKEEEEWKGERGRRRGERNGEEEERGGRKVGGGGERRKKSGRRGRREEERKKRRRRGREGRERVKLSFSSVSHDMK